MEVPDWWALTLLALAAYRLTRFLGWDDLPPIARARAWITGERHRRGEVTHKRQWLDDLLSCPFCLGFWTAVLWWGLWQAWPTEALIGATPLAIAALVGLIGKNLDA